MKSPIVMRLFALLILSMSYVAIMGATCGKCDSNDECAGGQVCNDGTCGSCVNDSQCADGQRCLRGVCSRN